MATAEVDFRERLWMWGEDIDEPRFLHVALRIKDPERSLRFYVDGCGLKLFDRINITPVGATVLFVGFDGDDYRSGGMIELASYADAGDEPYTHGTGFHHISFGVPDVRATISKLEAMGVEVTVPPNRYLDQGPWIAYVKDPDGYSVEFLQTRAD